MNRNNLAGRAAAWAASRPLTTISAWLAFAVLAAALGAALGTKTMPEGDYATGESARGEQMLTASGLRAPARGAVLIQSRRRTRSSTAVYAAVRDITTRLRSLDEVQSARSPLATGNGRLFAWDIQAAIVPYRIRGKAEDAPDKVEPILNEVAAVQRSHTLIRAVDFGSASTQHALGETIRKDFRRAELTTVPLTIAILLVAFGALVAAGLPVLLAFSGVLAAVGLTAIVSQILPASGHTNSVILLVGMAVGIDYSLFYLRREREERARGLSPPQAVLEAARTSGRAVLVSGLTVLIALAGMFFSGSKIFTSFAIGTMITVAVALLASLTVLPALLSKLGDRVDKGRLRFVGRGAAGAGEPRAWAFVLDRVLQRPGVAAAVSACALVALALPALGLQTKLPSLTDLPPGTVSAETRERVQSWFGGAQTPAIVVVEGDMTSPRVVKGLAGVQRGAVSQRLVSGPIVFRYNADKTVGAATLPLKGTGDDAVTKASLATIRNVIIPETIGAVPGVEVAITGKLAASDDFNTTMASRMPVVFAFVLVLVFALLLVAFRSIVVPIKAVVLNLLSVGAAYGVLVAVFQNEWAEGILGFESNGAVVSWVPMFLFVILFGLSMDYHVFILSRIRELVDGGMDTDAAVAVGIKRTASVVTSAAAVMVAVFGIFATLNILELKQMGVGLAAAILIDATLVRAILLPATMKLLGEWNWYLPAWLEWLPRFGSEPRARRPEPVDAAPALEPA